MQKKDFWTYGLQNKMSSVQTSERKSNNQIFKVSFSQMAPWPLTVAAYTRQLCDTFSALSLSCSASV